MPLASIAVGRSCRRRGLSTCRSHTWLLAVAAADEEPAYAAYIQCCWQGLPPAWPQRMPRACIVAGRGGCRRGLNACRTASAHAVCFDAGRCCRRRGLSACRLHAWLLAGAAAGEVLVHAACSHCGWQELPSASNERMPLASIGAGRRSGRWSLSTCCLHALLLVGAAAGARRRAQGGALVPRGLADQGKAEPLYQEALRVKARQSLCTA